MVSRHLELEVPLFEAKSAINLNETLIDLGLKDAFREPTGQDLEYRARIFKLLMSSRNDSKESITPAYVAWRAGTIILFLLWVPSPHRLFKNSSTGLEK